MNPFRTTSPAGHLAAIDWTRAGVIVLVWLLCSIAGGAGLAHVTGKIDEGTASLVVGAVLKLAMQLLQARANGPTAKEPMSL